MKYESPKERDQNTMNEINLKLHRKFFKEILYDVKYYDEEKYPRLKQQIENLVQRMDNVDPNNPKEMSSIAKSMEKMKHNLRYQYNISLNTFSENYWDDFRREEKAIEDQKEEEKQKKFESTDSDLNFIRRKKLLFEEILQNSEYKDNKKYPRLAQRLKNLLQLMSGVGSDNVEESQNVFKSINKMVSSLIWKYKIPLTELNNKIDGLFNEKGDEENNYSKSPISDLKKLRESLAEYRDIDYNLSDEKIGFKREENQRRLEKIDKELERRKNN